jgi:hypothetical protein
MNDTLQAAWTRPPEWLPNLRTTSKLRIGTREE